MPSSPTVDGSASGTFSGSATASLSLTTTLTNDLICCVVGYEQSNASTVQVSSVTATGLSFTKISGGVVADTGRGGLPHQVGVEIWGAFSAIAVTALSITVNMSVSIDDACMGVFGVNGVHGTSVVQATDPNLNSQQTGSYGSTYSVTWSTTNADDLIIWAATSSGPGLSGGSATGPGGVTWTSLFDLSNAGGTLFSQLIVQTASISSIQTGVTTTSSGTSASGVAMIASLSADASTAVLFDSVLQELIVADSAIVYTDSFIQEVLLADTATVKTSAFIEEVLVAQFTPLKRFDYSVRRVR